eukprot:951907-Amphidinium_carterae.1
MKQDKLHLGRALDPDRQVRKLVVNQHLFGAQFKPTCLSLSELVLPLTVLVLSKQKSDCLCIPQNCVNKFEGKI